ncbi:tRNA pseudouridine synthase B [Nitrosomonas sp. PY1]|nr:tRNA pseudouridine synthase B [Nitrosomonas sp. PY1]
MLLDKALGASSNKAVQSIKRLFFATKCGHTGTLDPMATGLLPLCLGEATKFSAMLLGADKTYQATLILGYLSTTGDTEGEISKVINDDFCPPTRQYCDRILTQFIGTITQIPPMYSALKYQGRPLYAYARDGKTVERKARQVQIYQLHIESLQEYELRLTIHCSTGTYIRTLAEDIGKALGYGGAYLTQLRRTRIDCFDIAQAQTFATLEKLDTVSRDGCLLPIDCLLQKFQAITLDDAAVLHITQGRIVSDQLKNVLPKDTSIRLYNPQQQFLGLGTVTHDQKIIAKRLLATHKYSII